MNLQGMKLFREAENCIKIYEIESPAAASHTVYRAFVTSIIYIVGYLEREETIKSKASFSF